MDAEPNKTRKTRRTRKSRVVTDNGLGPSESPTPPKPAAGTMTFYEALRKAMEEERKITKLEWGDESIYGFINGARLKIKLHDGVHDWILSDGDLLGTDWVVCADDRRADQE